MRSCSFTGHRQIKDSHRKNISDLLQRAIAYAYEQGCRDFYSGGAVGFDTLAAREVLLFRISHPDIRLVMLLPCIDQGKRWSRAEQDSYEYILRGADEVRYISDEYTDSCMRERNFALAERADLMIAYVCRKNSGAGQTVRMADKLGRQIYNLYPALDGRK